MKKFITKESFAFTLFNEIIRKMVQAVRIKEHSYLRYRYMFTYIYNIYLFTLAFFYFRK